LPEAEDLDTKGLSLSAGDLAKLLNVDVKGWTDEVPRIREHFAKFGSHLPKELSDEVDALEKRLSGAKN
jgi:phosphoenolpyruvate carboxykinase (GTP)